MGFNQLKKKYSSKGIFREKGENWGWGWEGRKEKD